MKLRPLVIDDRAKAQVARVVKHAEANHYRPGKGVGAPGDDPRFVAHLSTYRAVFSFTHSDGCVWRHLTVSVPEKNKFPNPIAAYAIAELFGFTGWDGKSPDIPNNWLGDVREGHIVLVQVIERDGKGSVQ